MSALLAVSLSYFCPIRRGFGCAFFFACQGVVLQQLAQHRALGCTFFLSNQSVLFPRISFLRRRMRVRTTAAEGLREETDGAVQGRSVFIPYCTLQKESQNQDSLLLSYFHYCQKVIQKTIGVPACEVSEIDRPLLPPETKTK
jgi:hypothetical protein